MADSSGDAGHDARMYYIASEMTYTDNVNDGDAGDTGAAVATTALPLVRDVTLSLNGTVIDVTSRNDYGWAKNIQGLRSWSANVTLVDDPSDAAYIVLKNAFLNGTVLGFAILSALTGSSSAYGLQGNAVVTSFERAEPMDGAQMMSMTLTGSRAAHWIGPV